MRKDRCIVFIPRASIVASGISVNQANAQLGLLHIFGKRKELKGVKDAQS